MKKNLHAVKNAKIYHCEALALRVLSVAVASCFGASGAYAAGTGGQFVNGTGSITTQGNLQTIINSPNSIINWNGFSSSASETIKFIQQNSSSAVLNRVVGTDPSVLLGTLTSNGRVFVINPNGVLFGATSVVDVAGLVASSLNISNEDFIAGKLNFIDAGSAGAVVNQGAIRTATGGSVYLVAPSITNSGIITSPQGQVVLSAGHSVQLVDAFTPDLRVQVDAGGSAVNVGSIVAHSGDIGIYGALITQGGTLDADTAVKGDSGTIILKATESIDMLAGAVTTASGMAGGVRDGGEIRIVSDGALNMRAGSEVHADGGISGGNGGFIELSGLGSMKMEGSPGAYTAKAKAGYTGGSILIDPTNIIVRTGGGLPGSTGSTGGHPGSTAGQLVLDPVLLKALADVGGFATVTLSATNDITVMNDIGAAAARFNHNLTLTAGHDDNISANIYLGTTKLLSVGASHDINIKPVGTNSLTLDAGNIFLGASHNINIGSSGVAGKINLKAAGSISAYASNALNIRAGDVFAGNGQTKDTTISITAVKDINFGALDVSIRGGDATASATGAGVHTATAIADVNIKAGGNFNISASHTAKIAAGDAVASAYAWNSNGAATNTAKADSGVTITVGKSLSISAGSSGGSVGSVTIHAGDAFASAYKGGSGSKVSLSGNQSATANAAVSITAGTDIFIGAAAPSGTPNAAVKLTTGNAYAEAYLWGNGDSNKMVGNNLAKATTGLSIKSTAGNINVDANNGRVSINNSYASASAYLGASGNKNVFTGANTATATNGITISALAAGKNVNISGDNVYVSNSYASAEAYKTVRSGHDNNTFTGNQAATATNGITLSAGGSVNISAASSGVVSIYANNNSGAYAKAYQKTQGTSASFNKLSGAQLANATNGVTIKAGAAGDVNISGGSVLIDGASAYAEAYNRAGDNAAFTNTLLGNNTANAKYVVSITAGHDINMSATNTTNPSSGRLSISAAEVGSASAFNVARGDKNIITGINAANANNSITLTAGHSISLTANSDVNVQGSYGKGSAYNYITGNSNTITGNNTAKGSVGVTLTATTGAISMTATGASGSVNISANNSAYAYGYNSANGNKNKITGNNTAAGVNAMKLSAGTGITLAANKQVNIQASSASATGYNYANGSSNAIVGNNTAAAKTTVDLAAKGAVSITATNGSASVYLGGSGDASAYNSIGSGGHTNTITGNNNASGVVGMTISGASITMDGKGVFVGVEGANSGTAYNYIRGSSHNKIIGNNTASGAGTIALSATGAISLNGHAGSATVSASTYGYASAYNDVAGGKLNTITGNNNATGNTAVSVKAGTTLSIAGTAVNMYVYDASGEAYNSAHGSSNVVTGNNTAKGTGTLALTAGGAVTITATTGNVSISANGGSPSATAYNYATGKLNKVTGNNNATGANAISIIGSSVTIGAKNDVSISGTNAYAQAYNEATGAGSHTVTGNNTAKATSTISIAAIAGDLNVTATSGHVSISDNYADASAYNYVNASNKNKVTGNNNATAGMNISLTATGAVNLTGKTGVYLYADDATASAYNYVTGNSNTVVGNHIANATNTLTIKGGTGIAINGMTGSAYISANGSIDALAYNYVNGDKNIVTGNHNATATGAITLTAPTISVAGTGVYIYGTSATASAYNSVNGNSNTVTGASKATANTSITLAATGAITIAGGTGTVRISGSETATASAYNYVNGTSNKVSGGNVANAANNLSITAGGALTLTGNVADVYVYGASAYGYTKISGSSNTVVGNQVANATGNVTLKAGGDLTVIATGNVNISAADSGYASAYNKVVATGNGNHITDNNTATANNTLTLSGANISVTGGGNVHISGSTGSGYAFNSVNGNSNTVVGNNKAAANTAVVLTTPGSLTIVAGGASVLSISADGYGSGSAYNSVAGNKNKVTGNNTATGTNTVSLTAGTTLSLTGGNVRIYGYSATGSAFNSVNGDSNTVLGNNIATGKVSVALKAAGAVTLAATATSGQVLISADSPAQGTAYNYASGNKNTVTGNNSASASNAISITGSSIALTATGTNGDVSIYGDRAEGTAYNYANGSLDKVTGNNVAKAATTIDLKATGDITLTGGTAGTVSISGNGAVDASAYNSAYGNNASALKATVVTGNNTATANNNITISAGGNLTMAAKNVYVYGTDVSGTAFNYQGGDYNRVTGNNVANAGASIALTAGKAISLAATGGTVSISANDSPYAFAGNSAGSGASHNTTLGNNTATATNDISLKAGTAVTMTGTNVDVYGYYAEATASHNVGGGSASANTLTGNDTATAKTSVNVTAGTGGITLTATGGDVSINAASDASAFANHSAGNSAGSQAFSNKLSGNDTATATNSITFTTTGNITLAGNNIYVLGSSAYARARNEAHGSGNVFTGANTATANTSVALNATGNISMTATSTASINAIGSAQAYAIHSASSSANTLGANKATTNTTVSLSGHNIAINGGTGVLIADGSGGVASANASSGNANIRGANTATVNHNVAITASGTLGLTAAAGSVSIYNASAGTYSALAYGAGNNTAVINSNTDLKAAGALAISGKAVNVYGGYYLGYASATGSAAGAVNTATATGNLNITGASVALTATAGNVSIYNSSGASAIAAGKGKSTATATANTNITATGALTISDTGGNVFIAGPQYSNSHLASASGASAAAVATAAATSNVTLKGSSVSITTDGNMTIGSPGTSPIMAKTAGSGTTKATSTGDVKVQAGVLTLSADNIFVNGGSATMTGANAKAEASTLIYTNSGTITTTAGDLDVTAGVGPYSVAGIASVGNLTFSIFDDINLSGGSAIPFQVVNGAYVRTIFSTGYRYGTAVTTTSSPAVFGVVVPATGPLPAFGIGGDYTISGATADPVAFIQIK